MSIRFLIGAALLATTIASGCDGASDKNERQLRPTAAISPRVRPISASSPLNWSATNCTLPDAPSKPIGQSADALTTAFGRPVADARFVLGDEMTPARNTLLNRLPMHGNERVMVREMIWTKSGCDLTVWLTQHGGIWQAVQTARASADAEY